MMKRKFMILVILSCCILIGCTESPSVYDNSSGSQNEYALTDKDLALIDIYSKESFEISEKSAIYLAKQYYCDMRNKSRGDTIDTSVQYVTPLINTEFGIYGDTINFVVDTAFTAYTTYAVYGTPYILGYAVGLKAVSDSTSGFVVVSADTRIPETILAAAESTSVSLQQDSVIKNDGLAFFLDCAEEYAISCIEESDKQIDSLKVALAQQYFPDYPADSVTVTITNTIISDTTSLSRQSGAPSGPPQAGPPQMGPQRLIIVVTDKYPSDWYAINQMGAND